MSDCGCGSGEARKLERKTLQILLGINGVMFLAEIVLGFLADSTGLLADSLDMLADAGVYGLSLYAVGQGDRHQSRAAGISGILQIALGLGVLVEVLRRFFLGSEPEGILMIGVSMVALLANTYCLLLIRRHRNAGIHMRASWIFSSNDVVANLGVIISGILVALFGSQYPDLLLGSIIAVIVVRGGIKIIKDVQRSQPTRNVQP